jgi:MoaA/NifB/PqqE/SkfB family radical SAM enzyme
METAARLDEKNLAHRIMDRSLRLAPSVLEQAFLHRSLRGVVLRRIEQHMVSWVQSQEGRRWPAPAQVVQDQVDMLRAMVASAGKALDRGQISHKVLRGLLRAFLVNVALRHDDSAVHAAQRFADRHGGQPAPSFLVISPTNTCNLRCTGCYASSGPTSERLEWDVFDRIVTEAKEGWGVRFFTISGGEPLTYRSHGKQLLDLAERHRECFFQMYTNGCLIDEQTAERMAEAGNLIPAISVEGLEDRTDARRGAGVFQNILRAMANLRRAGVPFGISMTPTRDNAEEVLSDDFLDFFFEQQQAVFGWLFQYMPIGRGFTADLQVTPQQRVWMWRRTWQIIRERKIMLADFWNCGTVSNGCIAAGKGYLYIDWSGKVMPCVFVPYAAANIHDLYARGGTLDDLYDLPYFRAIRHWQRDYAFGRDSEGRYGEYGNWLLPCSLRDNYAMGRRLIEEHQPEPEDSAAAEAMRDDNYRVRMLAYDEQLRQLFDPIWEREYLQTEAGASTAASPDAEARGSLDRRGGVPRVVAGASADWSARGDQRDGEFETREHVQDRTAA